VVKLSWSEFIGPTHIGRRATAARSSSSTQAQDGVFLTLLCEGDIGLLNRKQAVADAHQRCSVLAAYRLDSGPTGGTRE